MEWGGTGPDLDACGRHLTATVLPFLDGLGAYEVVQEHLQHGTGGPAAASSVTGRPGSPAAVGLLGLLALAAGDRATAVDCLARRLEFEQGRADDSPEDAANVRFWRSCLGAARRAADLGG